MRKVMPVPGRHASLCFLKSPFRIANFVSQELYLMLENIKVCLGILAIIVSGLRMNHPQKLKDPLSTWLPSHRVCRFHGKLFCLGAGGVASSHGRAYPRRIAA